MIKRRAEDPGLPARTSRQTFRATGTTTHVENGGPSRRVVEAAPKNAEEAFQ
jgi:hypothetical protein